MQDGLSYSHLAYVTENTNFDKLKQQTHHYIKAVSTLNAYWKKLVLTSIGKDSDINISRLFFMLQSSGTNEQCENVILMYPAQDNIELGSA